MIHVIVADNHALHLYECVQAAGRIEELAAYPSFIAPHERDMGADRPGRTVAGAAGIRHSFEPSTRAKETVQRRWLKAVGESLGSLLHDRDNELLILVAAPRLLSRLRAALPASLLARVATEVPRDLGGVPHAQLTKRLQPTIRSVMLKQGTLPRPRSTERTRPSPA
jgi:protein required for attachment to host cells